jgi:hypothetical protein
LHYEVQTSTGGAPTDVYNGTGTSATITNASPAGTTYTSRVRACDTYGCSGWTQATTVVNPPIPATPTFTGTPSTAYPDASYVVKWSPVTGATRYELSSWDDAVGNPVVVYTGSGVSFTATASGTVGQIQAYAVRACNVSGCSGVQPQQNVEVVSPSAPAAPTISAPSTVIAGGNVTVTWGASSSPGGYALHYELVTNKDGGAATQVYSGTATSATGVSGASPAGSTYGFGIRACDTYNCSGYAWASTLVQAPIPGTPTISGGGNVYPSKGFTISWSGVSGATSYQLFQSGSLVYNGAGTSKAFTAGGTVGAVYPYQVKACNATGCSGLSSQVNVTVVNPPAPATPATLNAPGTVIAGGNIALSWSASSSPGGYPLHYEVVYNKGSGNVSVYSGAGTSATITNAGPAGATYANYVRACDTYNCSGWKRADTAVQAPVPGAPTVSAPGTVVAGGSNPVSWSAAAGATSYQLHVWWNSSTATLYAGSGRSYSHTATTTVGLVYTYRVEACNSTGCSGWSAPVSTTVVAPPVPATPTLTAPGGVSAGSAINVSWSAVSGTTYYQLLGDAGTTASTLRYQGTARSYSIPTAMNRRDSSYTVSVRACNGTGCSGWRSATITVFGTG